MVFFLCVDSYSLWYAYSRLESIDLFEHHIYTHFFSFAGGVVAPPTDLSVSFHPSEEGTSVDDDGASQSSSQNESNNEGGQRDASHQQTSLAHQRSNRRIEMPPAFHFPEDQTPPSDLLASSVSAASSDPPPVSVGGHQPHQV